MTGRAEYEQSVKEMPNYPWGEKRPTWDELSDIAKWSWNKAWEVTANDHHD